MEEAKTPFQRVLDLKTPTELSAMIGRRQSTIWEWKQRGWAAPDACAAIAAAVNHEITADELMASANEGRAATLAAAAERRRAKQGDQQDAA